MPACIFAHVNCSSMYPCIVKRQDKTTLKQGAGHWPQCP